MNEFEKTIGETIYNYANIQDDEEILLLKKKNKRLKRDVFLLEQKVEPIFRCKLCLHYNYDKFNSRCFKCKSFICKKCGNNILYDGLYFCSVGCVER